MDKSGRSKMNVRSWSQQILICFMICALLAVPLAAHASPSSQLVEEIFRTLSEKHISTPNQDELAEAAIIGMLAYIDDQYTEYFNADEWAAFQDLMESDFVGIGVGVDVDDLGFVVNRVFKGSPAERAGIRVNDYFVEIDGKPVKGIKLEEFVSLIRGDEGSFVRIKLKRQGNVLNLRIKRAAITQKTVEGTYYGQGVGYLSISTFATSTADDFRTEWLNLRKNPLRSLIIDLRDNGGGFLDTAVELAEYFIPGKVLLQEVNRSGQRIPYRVQRTINSTRYPVNVPVTVLVNENSASASEAFAAALRDHLKARLVGKKTFGKGSVQEIFPLSNGAALKVTISKYLTPLSQSVENIGITPNTVVDYAPAQMIQAFRLAGMKSFSYRVNNQQQWFVNDVNTNIRVSMIKLNGNTYLPARLLASILNQAQISTPGKGALRVRYGSSVSTFDSGSGLLVRNGTSYLNIASFVKRVPGVRFSSGTNGLTLSNTGSK